MKTYKLFNNILGWIVFAIAATVYLLTIEPTASFWDCGEFIVSAFKLEVGHPPGNPIFMLTANLFTLLTSDVSLKATMVNAMSAVFSALTILFLFWAITHLARKILVKESEESNESIPLSKIISILGCGAVGALVYTFSDTFWFSAVEAEVYAYSSLLTAFVFWLILKWEDVANEPHADRWLIVIAYIIGISIAVHLLNLLCIPAIVLVYYFKRYQNPNLKGSIIALFISFAILGIILFGIMQGLVKVAGWFELLFVNVLGFSYNSGVAFYMILVVSIILWGVWETMREKYNVIRTKIAFVLSVGLLGIPFMGNNVFIGILLLAILALVLFYYKRVNPVALNTILLGLFVILIGYSSYALIMIRSSSNPPMDQNSPEDVFTLRTYLGREQYGETPLFYGPTYASQPKDYKVEGSVWAQIAKHDPSEKDKYFVATHKEKLIYFDELNTLFPRMYSRDANHIQGYKYWANITDRNAKRVRMMTADGPIIILKPTFFQNLRYFFSYQVNYMYWRYFMWNFAGRQNDIQGNGGIMNGNWISGIKFLDALWLGPQDDLPDSIAKNNGHNKFYMLPLLLGLLGIFFQISSGKKGIQGFWITFLLFFMLGLAIVVYLNQKPFEPRERDYAYAGSFYAFSIWIGIGVAVVIRGLTKYAKMKDLPAAIAGSVLCLLVPIQMVSQTWDDHDRSKRYVSRDFGYNYLTTCEPNAVIFTMGDNDTFPLWYNQEVEGYRTDVRVCNLSYLQTDWYIDQMKRQAYESEPLPISWKKTDYITGTHESALILKQYSDPKDVTTALNWIKSDDLRTKRVPGYREIDNVRTTMLYIPVDSAAVIRSGIVKPENHDKIVKELLINLGEKKDSEGNVIESGKTMLSKQEMMILDMLNNNRDWTRPFYFATTVSSDMYLRLDSYFRRDGIAYRLVPYNTGTDTDVYLDSLDANTSNLSVDTDILYDNMMHKYRWGNLEQPGIYLDENSMRMAKSFRMMFGMLSQNLINENKKDKAEEALDYGLKVLPRYNVPYDFSTYSFANQYLELGKIDKAREIYDVLVATSLKNLRWYSRLNNRLYTATFDDIRREFYMLGELLQNYKQINPEAFEAAVSDYNLFGQRYQQYITSLKSRQMSGGTNQ